MSFDPQDAIQHGVQSNCCQAAVLLGDICSDCKEGCEPESIEDEEEDDEPTESQLERHYAACYRAQERAVLKGDQDDRDLRDAGRGHLVHL
jgi:hypothetical protein